MKAKSSKDFFDTCADRCAEIAGMMTMPMAGSTWRQVFQHVQDRVQEITLTTGWAGKKKIPGVDAWCSRNAANQLFFLPTLRISVEDFDQLVPSDTADRWVRLWIEYWTA